MSNKRYRITQKTTGDILLDMPFEKHEDVIFFVKALFAKGIKADEMECCIIEGDKEVADYAVIDKVASEIKATRRTRQDKGKTHAKAVPVKKLRRGQSLFAVPLATLVRCGDSKESLTEALSKLENLQDYAVIQGRLSLPERVVQYKLRGSGDKGV